VSGRQTHALECDSLVGTLLPGVFGVGCSVPHTAALDALGERGLLLGLR
jgi:hypothetical protein